jgi:hypothetical protein
MVETKQISTQAACAKAIRKELKAAFPSIKFSIRSESFAGGDAVRIGWTDGPTTKQIDEITGKYQYGHFDGMIDMYENSNSRDDIPQAKYVQTSRSYSEEMRTKAREIISANYGKTIFGDDDYLDWFEGGVWGANAIYRHLCNIDFTLAAPVLPATVA